MATSEGPVVQSSEVLTRVFRLGSLDLSDPAPELSAGEAIAYHAHALPMINECSLGDGYAEDGRWVVPLHKPAATTKGDTSGDTDQELEQALEAWAESVSTSYTHVERAWAAALPLLRDLSGRAPAPEAFDSRVIPLA